MRLWTAGIVLLGALSQAQAEEYSKSYRVSGRAGVHVHVDDSRVWVVTSDTQQVDFIVSREGTSAITASQLTGMIDLQSVDGDQCGHIRGRRAPPQHGRRAGDRSG